MYPTVYSAFSPLDQKENASLGMFRWRSYRLKHWARLSQTVARCSWYRCNGNAARNPRNRGCLNSLNAIENRANWLWKCRCHADHSARFSAPWFRSRRQCSIRCLCVCALNRASEARVAPRSLYSSLFCPALKQKVLNTCMNRDVTSFSAYFSRIAHNSLFLI